MLRLQVLCLSCSSRLHNSQYIVVGGKVYTASQVRTTSRSWDKGVLTDLCHPRVLTDLCLTL